MAEYGERKESQIVCKIQKVLLPLPCSRVKVDCSSIIDPKRRRRRRRRIEEEDCEEEEAVAAYNNKL